MLLYYNKSFFWLLLERRGSVFYRLDSVFGGLFIAALGGIVQWMFDSDWEYAPRIHHHYAFQALGAGVTFAIVFRTQLAWNRYWEAVTQLHFMYSKFADAFSQFQAFAEVTRKNVQEKDPLKADRIRLKQWRLKINYALLSSVAADRLNTGDNQRMEDVRSTGVRTRNTMRINKETQTSGLPKMKLRSEIDRQDSKSDVYAVFELPSAEQIQLMMASNDMVSTVMYWIIWDLADCMKDIDIAPPIQSRMYQELSNGMLGFNNCLKIADVPFPLPFAQLLGLLLVAFSCFIPVYVINFTGSPIAGPVLCFFLFESLWCLNEVAKELENPFGQDINDIHLPDFHMRFVDCLQDVSVDDQAGMLKNPFLGIDPGLQDPAQHGIEVLPEAEVDGMKI